MDRRDITTTVSLHLLARLLFSYRGAIGRREFVLAELMRGIGLIGCYALYQEGWVVAAATLMPVAIWPGVVATIKRFRDLGHDPLLILPVLVYLSAGFAVGYRYDMPILIGLVLASYLLYISLKDGISGAFDADDYIFDV